MTTFVKSSSLSFQIKSIPSQVTIHNTTGMIVLPDRDPTPALSANNVLKDGSTCARSEKIPKKAIPAAPASKAAAAFPLDRWLGSFISFSPLPQCSGAILVMNAPKIPAIPAVRKATKKNSIIVERILFEPNNLAPYIWKI